MQDDISDHALVSLDDLMPGEPPPAPASTAVAPLSMEPAAYVALAYGELETETRAAIANVGMTVHDVDTPQGMALAKRDRATFRDLRLACDKLHKQYKAPVLELGRMIDGRKNDIITWLEPYEQHYQLLISAAEERAAAAEQALIEAERTRVADIEERIAALYALPGQALNQSATNTETMLIAAQAVIIDASYGEYTDKAQTAKDFAITALEQALAAKQAAEANQAELERLRALQPAAPAPDAAPPAPARKGARSAPKSPPAMEPLHALRLAYLYLTGGDVERDDLLHQITLTLQAAGMELPAPSHP